MNRAIQKLFLTTAVMTGVSPLLWSQSPPVKFTSFPLPITSARDIAAGPDGNLWITDTQNAQILRMTPAGVVTPFTITTEDGSWAITRGGGALFFSGNAIECCSGGLSAPARKQKAAISDTWTNLGRMTPQGVLTSYATGEFEFGRGVAFGPDGNLWFTYEFRNAIGRLNPGDGSITDFQLSGECCGANDITLGPDGALWYTRGSSIGRITTAGQITEFSYSSVGEVGPVSITAGPDGALWFTDESVIGRITTAGVITTFQVTSGVRDVVAGPDGAIWYTLSGHAPGLGRLTTSGVRTEYTVSGTDGVDSHITVGPDGALWFTRNDVVIRAQVSSLQSSLASMSFLYRVGGVLPASQMTSVTSSGSAIAVTPVVTPAATWLSVAPPSGTTPLGVTATVNPLGLAPGPYTSGVNLTGDAANSPLNIPVSLTVLPPLTAAPGTLTFNFRQGAAIPANQPVTVSSGGSPVVVTGTATTTSGGAWLSVSPPSGQTPAGFSAAVNPAGLAAGTYTGILRFAGQDALGGQVDVPVTLNVLPPLTPNPASLTFDYRIGAQVPAAKPIALSTAGVPVTVSAAAIVSTPAGGTWLSVVPGSGTTPTNYSVSVNPNGLAAGSYTGLVRFTSNDAANGTRDVPVTLTVRPALSVTPGALTFAFRLDAPVPDAQPLSITSGGVPVAVNVTASVSTPAGATWLSVTPASLTTPGTASVSVNTTGLAAGTYTGVVRVAATDAAGGAVDVPVTLAVNSKLTSTPASLTFNYRLEGTLPAAQAVSLTDSGPVPFVTSVAVTTPAGGTWLQVAPAEGTTPASLTISVNPAGLSTGTYTGIVTSSATDTAGGKSDVVVTLNVLPKLTAQPASLTFTYRTGAPIPDGQTLVVSSSGPRIDVRATTSIVTPSAGNWLSVIPTGGSTPATFNVQVNPTGLRLGTYSGFVNVQALDQANGTLPVPVTLNVVSQLAPTAAPPSLTFISVGRSVPPEQTVVISRPGAGNLVLQTDVPSSIAGLEVFGSPAVEIPPTWTTRAFVPPGASDVSARLRINPAAIASLPFGTYPAALSITTGLETAVTTSVPVTLEMRRPNIQVTGQCPVAVVGEGLSIPLVITGGGGNYLVALSAPAGFTVNPATGVSGEVPFRPVISGVAPTAGVVTVVATVSDTVESTPAVFTCNMYASSRYVPPVVLTTATCPAGDVPIGTPINRMLLASGGSGVFSFNSSDLPPGLRIMGNVLTGIPTEAGTFTYTLTASSAGAQSAEMQCTFRVLPSPLKITSGCPTDTNEGQRYYFPIFATGGMGGVNYSITINGLPPGLVAVPGGIQGSAAKQGSYNLDIQVRSGDQVVTQTCPMKVNDAAGRPPGPNGTISCPTDPVPSGSPVSIGISASGGTGAYTFAASAPGWLQLTQNGSSATLSGIAGPPGRYPVSATISDANGSTQVSCTIVVNEAPLVLTGPTCPASVAVGSPIDLPVSATGGTQPYQWSLSAGPGLSLSSASGASTRITGAPTEIGPMSVTTAVTDASGNRRQSSCTIDVTQVPLRISGQGCPTAPFNRPGTVTVSLAAAGGRGDYSWQLSGPAFLSLSSASGQTVSVSGAPTAPGNVSFTATLTDQANSTPATFTCAFTVPPVPAPTLSINGLTISANPAQSNDLELVLSPSAPVPLTATVVLSFGADVALAGVTDNPLVQFTNGLGRTIAVTVPAGQTRVPLGARVNLSNVAGTVRLTVSSLADAGQQILGAAQPGAELRLPRTAPVLESVTFGSGGVVVRGFSNTLDMQSVTITFAAAPEATIEGPSTFNFTTEIQQFFRNLYQNRPASGGSAFEVRFPVTLGGDTGGIASVTVTFRNSAGEVTGQATLQ